MSDNTSLRNEFAALAADLNGGAGEVEQRLRRLENAIAAMQDQTLMEERVVERVVDKIHTSPRPAANGFYPESDRLMLAARPVEAVPAEPPPRLPFGAAAGVPLQSAFGVVEVVRELRAMCLMYFDARFRVSAVARFAPAVALGMMVLSYLFFGLYGVPLIGTVMDKTFDVVAAVVVYKLLSREAARYRATVGDRPGF